ncbi:MAG: 1-acyl-sn-glycerol-3-phosphate acyltransferase, partial [Spirochaetaceae bacterium]|nr:1-acyl-sn-glycerol-3-phosphate acyltransferase [Spirochaetaceae bacterium]
MNFKSFWVFFRVGLTILFRSKSLRQAKKFDKQGKIKERDAVVYDKAHGWSRELFDRILKGVKVTVKGLENLPRDRAVVLIGNHQGYLDIPLLLGFVDKPIAFIAKAEILKIPVLSTWMKLMQCTFLV